LQDELLRLAEGAQIPITTTLLGKSVIPEVHPLFVGLYEGAMGNEKVTQFVEESDCVILLGTFMTDINLGIFTANLDPGKCIYATSEQLRMRHHHFHDVALADFLRELADRKPRAPQRETPKIRNLASEKFELQPQAPITISRLIGQLNQRLDDETIVIADIGDALFGATELVIRGRTEFISPAYYTSMGFSIPAALGAQVARPNLRSVVIVGDGAFQMTGMELSTIVRHRYPTVVILLDNKGYGTERVLHAGDFKYNEIHGWAYHKLPEVLGGGKGYEVRTEGEFDAALNAAWQDKSGPSLIHVHIGLKDHSTALNRLAEKLSKRVV
jgi:indolepyruvate decarboxylase